MVSGAIAYLDEWRNALRKLRDNREESFLTEDRMIDEEILFDYQDDAIDKISEVITELMEDNDE